MIVTCDRLAAFLWMVLQDYMTFGEVEKIIEQLDRQRGQHKLEGEGLVRYVETLSRRLRETVQNGIRRV